jgi:hypothetical protein
MQNISSDAAAGVAKHLPAVRYDAQQRPMMYGFNVEVVASGSVI